jgi:hypothetical protein
MMRGADAITVQPENLEAQQLSTVSTHSGSHVMNAKIQSEGSAFMLWAALCRGLDVASQAMI